MEGVVGLGMVSEEERGAGLQVVSKVEEMAKVAVLVAGAVVWKSGASVGGLRTLSEGKTLRHTATLCNTLQHSATLCNTLQHSATLCNTLSKGNSVWS